MTRNLYRYIYTVYIEREYGTKIEISRAEQSFYYNRFNDNSSFSGGGGFEEYIEKCSCLRMQVLGHSVCPVSGVRMLVNNLEGGKVSTVRKICIKNSSFNDFLGGNL